MVTRSTEAVTPPAVVERLLAAAGDDLVLVGGQALAFWAQRFGVRSQAPNVPAITNDVDFHTLDPADRQPVVRLAGALHGTTIFPPRRALTILVGQAVRPVGDGEVLNVDVIARVNGVDTAKVHARSVVIDDARTGRFRVMHPLDVLRSRVANLHKIHEKQNDKGAEQLNLAVAVVREFLRSQIDDESAARLATGRSPIQRFVSEIEQLACEDAARKVAKRWGIHVADAIDPLLIPPGPFWTKRWPGLRELMSEPYRVAIDRKLARMAAKPARKA